MGASLRPLIVGAGPVGLGAALFLARQGLPPRLVEMRSERSSLSRALAVNPRTLDILAPTGVTDRMLALGLPIRGACVWRQRRMIASISFDGGHPRYPFMLALSQATTERLLAEAFEAAGGAIERGVKMVGCRALPDRVEVTMEPTAGGPPAVVGSEWLLAADGAHSVARDALGIEFPGSSLADDWHLADVPLETGLPADRAHVCFLEDGTFQFLIRVVDDESRRAPTPVWRVVSNVPHPLSRLILARPAGEPVWASSFHVAHRVAATFAAGRVYLAGDAAHVHSPVGARGMNLGLEDAWVLSELMRKGRAAAYDRLRRPTDARVVRRVEIVSRVASAASPLVRLLRAFIVPVAARVPFVRSRAVATVMGLDVAGLSRM